MGKRIDMFILYLSVFITGTVCACDNGEYDPNPDFKITHEYGVDWLVWVDDIKRRTYSFTLYIPDDYAITNTEYPILISLHGGGSPVYNPGPHPLNELGGGPLMHLFNSNGEFVPEGRNMLHPDVGKSFVIYPVIACYVPNGRIGNWRSDTLNMILDYMVSEYRINKKRIYITGGSFGGWGTWNVTFGNQRTDLHPAAIVPLCGGFTHYPTLFNGTTDNFNNLPVWQFQSLDDGVVPYQTVNRHLESLMPDVSNIMKDYPYSSDNDFTVSYDVTTGLGPWKTGVVYPTGLITYTLFKNEGHGIGNIVNSNSAVWDWVFSQHRE